MKKKEAETIAHLDRTIRDLTKVRDDLSVAYEFQWLKPVGETESTGRRQSGPFSDPTGETAVDDARMRLRDSVRRVESVAPGLAEVSFRMEAKVRTSLRPYRGD